MEIGALFHLGIYSILAYDDVNSLKKRPNQNGSEWILKRLLDNTRQKIHMSGSEQSQRFIKNEYGISCSYEYETIEFYYNLIKIFDDNYETIKNNIKEWINTCKDLNLTYVILTVKSHDGFVLYPSKYGGCSSKYNILKLFVDEAKLQNMKVGVYYSMYNIVANPNKKYITEVIIPQIEELLLYNLDYFKFDGYWPYKAKYFNSLIKTIYEKIHLFHNKIKISDRSPIEIIPLSNVYFKWYDYYSEFYTNSDITTTIGYSWGACDTQTEKDYKSYDILYNIYNNSKNINSSLTINFALDKYGNFNTYELYNIKNFHIWKKYMENPMFDTFDTIKHSIINQNSKILSTLFDIDGNTLLLATINNISSELEYFTNTLVYFDKDYIKFKNKYYNNLLEESFHTLNIDIFKLVLSYYDTLEDKQYLTNILKNIKPLKRNKAYLESLTNQINNGLYDNNEYILK